MNKAIFDEQELREQVEKILAGAESGGTEVLYMGPVVKPVFTQILESLEDNARNVQPRFILPGLTDRDFHGTSFLYNFNILASKARVESDARDTLLIGADRVLGISCISNMAAGLQGKALSHGEVEETGRQVSVSFRRLMLRILEKAAEK